MLLLTKELTLTKNKSLKARLKEEMRGKKPIDEETGKPLKDPVTGKDYPPTPPKGITAYDVIKRFDKNMGLQDAIIFLMILEQDDRMITRSKIEDREGNGVAYVYHYEHKRRKRGVRR